MIGSIGNDQISRTIDFHAYRQIQRSGSHCHSVTSGWQPFLNAVVAVIEDVHVAVGIKGDRRGITELVCIGTWITGGSRHCHALSGS